MPGSPAPATTSSSWSTPTECSRPTRSHRRVAPLADPAVGAVSGNTKVANRDRVLGRWQHIEYVVAFNLDRRVHDVLRCMPTIPGAIGAFRRAAIDGAGGVSADTLAEDTDLTIAIGRAGWRIYEQHACAWTDAPATVSALRRQRHRWCHGTLQAIGKHRGALTQRSPLSRYGIPYVVLFHVLLPLLVPLIDVMALRWLVFGGPVTFIVYWLAFNVIQLEVAIHAFRLDREGLRVLWSVPLLELAFRQLRWLVVVQSLLGAGLDKPPRWRTRRPTQGTPVAPAVARSR